MLFVIHNNVLCYNDPTKPYDAQWICIPEVKLKETFQICHKEIVAWHRGFESTLDKFQRSLFLYCHHGKILDKISRTLSCLSDSGGSDRGLQRGKIKAG